MRESWPRFAQEVTLSCRVVGNCSKLPANQNPTTDELHAAWEELDAANDALGWFERPRGDVRAMM
jgi:hypothetical protein